MSILWNIFLCTVALQICAPKRKLSGSKEDHSFQPSVRLVHSPSASNISDMHKHSSIRMRHKWWSRDIFHQFSARTKVNYTFFYHNTRSCGISLLWFSLWYTPRQMLCYRDFHLNVLGDPHFMEETVWSKTDFAGYSTVQVYGSSSNTVILFKWLCLPQGTREPCSNLWIILTLGFCRTI